ncbi:LPD1 domain-containing protein [Paenibacillus sp. FSL P4-0288]|uniref:LPD1 domain-containing protein n=1 Tax=Paenibacillus sp. FSL P4-0288 TaxID=2921633 RepID=UPI0030F76523
MTKLIEVADVRTEGQLGNLLAYDVGEEVFGSRKDIAALRKEFQDTIGKGSVAAIMTRLESINPGLAAQYCVKENVLQKFDYDKERRQGTDIYVAGIKKLLLDRISTKPEGTDALSRSQYINAIEEVEQVLSKVKTLDEFKAMQTTLRARMRLEQQKDLNDLNRLLTFAQSQLEKGPSQSDLESGRYLGDGVFEKISHEEWKGKKEARITEYFERIAQYEENSKKPLYVLGEKFTNFFLDRTSGKNTINNVLNKENLKWDDYLTPGKKERVAKGTKRKEWERKVDDPYYRSGGRVAHVEKPEDAVTQFMLKAVQFGHWLDDSSGKFHLVKTAEAFQDLADLIRFSDEEISFGGKLSIAFGARGKGGKGAAIAHYEPAMKIINMTKERSPGALAHEWAHGFDNNIHGVSTGYDTIRFASEGLGIKISENIRNAYEGLIKVILEGDGTNPYTVKVPNEKKSFRRVYSDRRKAVQTRGLSLDVVRQFANEIIEDREIEAERIRYKLKMENERAGFAGSEDLMKKLKKIEKKRKAELNELYQELMYIHYQHTGDYVEHIEVPLEGSMYVNRMREHDGKGKPYYSTIIEMFARCFESWVEAELNKQGLRNNYLVCGTGEEAVAILDAPFPAGKERELIFKQMDTLMRAVASEGIFKS